MASKIFTPAEATRTLPLVRQIVGDVLEQGRELRRLQEDGELTPEQRDRAYALVETLETLFSELEALGCSFRAPNFEYGLVDFPGVIDGELVHLCWRDDEAALLYYHDPQAGFAGRKRIPAELLSASR